MYRKKMISVVGILLLAVLFLVIGVSRHESDIIYQSEDVKVTRLKEPGEKIHYEPEWLDVSEELAFVKHPVILVGSIEEVTPAVVDYEGPDYPGKGQISILDVRIEEILANNTTMNLSDHVKVGIPYNESNRVERYPVVEKGKTFLMFAMDADVLDTPEKVYEYVDLWVYFPNELFAEEVNGQYIAGDFFETYVEDDKKISTSFGLTQTSAEAYANQTLDAGTLSANAEGTEPTSILNVMKERMDSEDDTLWSLADNNYIVEKAALEKIVSDLAVDYSGTES